MKLSKKISAKKEVALCILTVMILFPLVLSAQDNETRILFFGDSITAGAGVGKQKAYPAIIRQKIDSLERDLKVVNAGLSGETSAGGLRRVDWILKQPVSIFILELGGNDGLRGIDLTDTKRNLQEIIDKVEASYPDAKLIIAGMEVPPNLGQGYTEKFKQIYPELAKNNDAKLIPSLLKNVGRKPSLMQSDGIHPNAEGHKIVAKNVWKVLEPVLENLERKKP